MKCHYCKAKEAELKEIVYTKNTGPVETPICRDCDNKKQKGGHVCRSCRSIIPNGELLI